MMRRILGTLAIGAALLVSAVGFAEASHPTQMCVDIGEDTRHPVRNDDMLEGIGAGIGSTDAGHPPQQEGCVIEPGGNAEGTNVDFEITGVGDPDSSDTPETPDLTCTVPADSNHCYDYRGHTPDEAGNQTIRAWIDFDLDDATVTADLSEGYDETATPGYQAEPDATDVSLWSWGEYPPPPCDSGSCPVESQVTISFRSGTFSGAVRSDYRECVTSRVVKLWKKRPGPDRRKTKTYSDHQGEWRAAGFESARGRHYATVTQHYTGMNSAGMPTQLDCLQDRSRVIELP